MKQQYKKMKKEYKDIQDINLYLQSVRHDSEQTIQKIEKKQPKNKNNYKLNVYKLRNMNYNLYVMKYVNKQIN